MIDFIAELNEDQRKAALHGGGAIIILAGAGSGKTKTIVARAAYLVLKKNVDPRRMLILTFTNKAAKEMRDRGTKLIKQYSPEAGNPVFSTFHAWALQFLKAYIKHKGSFDGVGEKFSIAEESVQKKVITDLIKEKFPKEEDHPFSYNDYKGLGPFVQNEMIPYHDVSAAYRHLMAIKKDVLKKHNIFALKDLRRLAEIYCEYKAKLRDSNSVDFDDLMSLSVKILEEDKKTGDFMKHRYDYIMVDEFQDTNKIQIRLLDHLVDERENICVVGDDSQSIYGWRGAEISFILNFHKKYKKTVSVNLVKNYRSTKGIVKHANSLIGHAEEKHEFKKALVAFKREKGAIDVKSFYNEFRECEWIVDKISSLINDGVQPKDIAVLYRSNWIYPTLEKYLLSKRIPYSIVKGRSIVQKKAAQEVISFFQVIYNRYNSLALKFILTSQMRIMSEKNILKLEEEASKIKIGFAKFFFSEESEKLLSKSVREKAVSFKNSIDLIGGSLSDGNMEVLVSNFTQYGGLIGRYEDTIESTKSETTKTRCVNALEDINHILNIARTAPSLEEFLEMTSLEGEEHESGQHVNLMTVHASKGLEFDNVFVIRMNQGVFPTTRSLNVPSLIEEERRLAYVALTRAKSYLAVTTTQTQRREAMFPSQFLAEAGLLKKNEDFHF